MKRKLYFNSEFAAEMYCLQLSIMRGATVNQNGREVVAIISTTEAKTVYNMAVKQARQNHELISINNL